MQIHNRWIIVFAAAALALIGCGNDAPKTKAAAPAAASAAAGPGGVKRITLTDLETKRLGIAFAEVTKTGDLLTVPYNTLLYDTAGVEWAFSNPEPNVYMRTKLQVIAIEGDKVFLRDGPAMGTKLVTNGAAELYGIEFGVGK
jgi:hypothetical protein